MRQHQFGPMVIDSLIRAENKFMDIRRLHELYQDLAKSRRVQERLQTIVRAAQEAAYLNDISEALRLPGGSFRFNAATEQYNLVSPRGVLAMHGERLAVAPARLIQERDVKADLTWDAAELELSARPVSSDQLSVQATLRN